MDKFKYALLSAIITIFVQTAAAGCLENLAKDVNMPEKRLTIIMVECGNMFLKGQFGYLQTNTKAGYNMPYKAGKLIDYHNCELLTRQINAYVKRCEYETED